MRECGVRAFDAREGRTHPAFAVCDCDCDCAGARPAAVTRTVPSMAANTIAQMKAINVAAALAACASRNPSGNPRRRWPCPASPAHDQRVGAQRGVAHSRRRSERRPICHDRRDEEEDPARTRCDICAPSPRCTAPRSGLAAGQRRTREARAARADVRAGAHRNERAGSREREQREEAFCAGRLPGAAGPRHDARAASTPRKSIATPQWATTDTDCWPPPRCRRRGRPER